ncbi:hypothetical protein DACRYDRAFT_24505 [Dacryopinax primogenitus]|uniref:Uncharacterized protein n=1 Tax=Dacryopinax primogenitus (strain DJM 731) TaxID=1858805 RepID=M5FSZ6_DACPD|nr:uncharacterized protein DACRYDRAFT_24505 [Dacryopinax primogenitus]EJT98454.1 hypothetical protein DACRYDRAFT_24505 [Dacryopinax primogenitus]
MVNIGIDEAAFFGIICLAFFYGIFFTLFCLAVYVLAYPQNGRRVNIPFLISTALFFCLITLYFIVRWMRAYVAFITSAQAQAGGAILFLEQVSEWHVAVSTSLWAVTGALADLMLIYRLWLVWDRSYYVVILPLIMCLGSLVTVFAVVYEVSHAELTTAYATAITNWAYSFLSLGLAQNFLVTGLIVLKIWKINMGVRGHTSTVASLWPVIAVLMESGALYSSCVMITLITYVTQNNGSAVMTDIIVPIIGITFMLIIVRVGLGFTKSRSNAMTSGQNYPSRSNAAGVMSSRRPQPNQSSNGLESGVDSDYPLHDIRVTLEREVIHEFGSDKEPSVLKSKEQDTDSI